MSASLPPKPYSRRVILLAGAALAAVTLTAYLGCFEVPFVFDDLPAIVENPAIRRLWPPQAIFAPPLDGGVTVAGRPAVALTFAANYALGGTKVWGYHAGNLLIHVLAGLVLFGVVRRTLTRPIVDPGIQSGALPIGLAVAAIWLLHPLQTESVTYLVQRAESLMGLCYLTTLYGFIRGSESVRPGRWWGVSISACLLGMASKEVMVTAPLMVFLYDRTFLAGSFRGAWQQRWRVYLGLSGAWLLLAYLAAGNFSRGGTAGFGTDISPWDYLLTQCRAVVHYLWLSIWPDPLVFDYGTATAKNFAEVWPQALLLLGLGAGTVVALRRYPVWGFLGVWFFAILAPSSSVVPVASQTMAEHRMYLSLAAVVTLIVIGLYGWLRSRAWAVCAVIVAGCGWLTAARNGDYRSELSLWSDTVAHFPENGRAHNNLGKAVFGLGRAAESVPHFEEAIRREPTDPEPRYNLGLALARLGRRPEAIGRYAEALRLQPKYAEAHLNLGNALLAEGRLDEAGAHYAEAVRLKPGMAEAHSNLANYFLEVGRGPEAVRQGEEAVRIDPANGDARFNLANALARTGQMLPAMGQYEKAMQLNPGAADVANNLANVLVELDRLPEAIRRYEEALRLKPDYLEPRRNLIQVLVHLGRIPEAVAHCRVLLQLRPGDAEVRAELARLEALERA